MRKKSIALLMALVLVLLAGCGGTPAPSSPSTEAASTSASTPASSATTEESKPVVEAPEGSTVVTLWHYFNGEQDKALTSIVESFNAGVGAENNYFVIAENQGNTADLEKKIQSASDSGVETLPTIVHGYPDIMATLHAKEQLGNLGAYLTEEEIAGYYPSFIKEGSQFGDDSVRLLPIAKSTELLFVNRTLWDNVKEELEATDEDLTTWEGIANVGKAYFEKYDKPFYCVGSFANFFYLTGYQQGVEYVSADGTVVIDRDAAERTYNFLASGVNEGWMAIKDGTRKYPSDFLNVGDIVCFADSNSGTTFVFPKSSAAADASEDELVFMNFPVWNDAVNTAVIQQGAGMAICAKGEEEEKAAVFFLSYLTNAENTASFSMGSGYIPVQQDAKNDPTFAAFLAGQDAEGADLPLKQLKVSNAVNAALNQFDTYTMYYTPAFDGSNLVRRAVEDEVGKIFTGLHPDFDSFYNELTAQVSKIIEGR